MRVVAAAWSRMIWNPPRRCSVVRASHPVSARERVLESGGRDAVVGIGFRGAGARSLSAVDLGLELTDGPASFDR